MPEEYTTHKYKIPAIKRLSPKKSAKRGQWGYCGGHTRKFRVDSLLLLHGGSIVVTNVGFLQIYRNNSS